MHDGSKELTYTGGFDSPNAWEDLLSSVITLPGLFNTFHYKRSLLGTLFLETKRTERLQCTTSSSSSWTLHGAPLHPALGYLGWQTGTSTPGEWPGASRATGDGGPCSAAWADVLTHQPGPKREETSPRPQYTFLHSKRRPSHYSAAFGFKPWHYIRRVITECNLWGFFSFLSFF